MKGYTAADTDTMTYIIAEVKNAIVRVSEEFQRFYCQTVLIGNWPWVCSLLKTQYSVEVSYY